MKPLIAITVGDPAGIGPEVAIKAAADPRVREACEPMLYGPHDAAALETFEAGHVSARAGQAAYDAVVAAVTDAMAGRVDAVATAPISKEAFAAAGLAWPGHTDLLASLCHAPRVAMMFDSPALRVVLATVHVPLREVAARLTPGRLSDTIDLALEALPRFGCQRARIAVAGLNPHAGEHGVLGHEDDEVILPVVETYRQRGHDISGPIPGDTVFVRAARGEFDAVVACYHDQGLIPVKLLAFGTAVNVTLGLPIIRTSVDHGTAFDIARKNLADPQSMVAAVLLAARLARPRLKPRPSDEG